MRVSSLRLLLICATACGLAALLLPLGATAKPHRRHRQPQTHITINRWYGETLGGTPYSVKPHQTITHCATDPAKVLEMRGRVRHTVAGRHIVVQFLLNGAARDTYHEQWTGSGNGTFHEGIYNEEGLPDGRWTLKVLQGRRTIGASWVLLAADPSC